jgi:hypothetical protein
MLLYICSHIGTASSGRYYVPYAYAEIVVMMGCALNVCGDMDVEKQFALWGSTHEDEADEPHLDDWKIRKKLS